MIVDRGIGGSFEVIHKERHFVSLAENGIGSLSQAAMDRGVAALVDFAESLKQYTVDHYKIIGTSALRSANNSQEFLQKVKIQTNLDIEIISGDREAELIYKGVSRLLEPTDDYQMVIDVGGGSVEFMLIHQGTLLWAESFDIGIGVLYNLIEFSDPCTSDEIQRLDQFLHDKLESLRTAIYGKDIKSLIGASGSFEVIQTISGDELSTDEMTSITMSKYRSIAEKLISSTESFRLGMAGLPHTRVKLIVVTIILINKAIELIAPDELLVSPYALKEGVLSELTAPI